MRGFKKPNKLIMSETQKTSKSKNMKLKLQSMAIDKLHYVINKRINVAFLSFENFY